MAIAARARSVLAEVDAARAEVDELRGVLRGRIWIGRWSRPAGSTSPDCSRASAAPTPGVEVSLREGIAADMLR